MSLSILQTVFMFLILRCPHLLADSQQGKKSQVIGEEILPPCQACKTIVNTFLWGLNMTNKKYSSNEYNSEERLIEIKDNMCSDIQRGQKQCYNLLKDWDQLFGEYWVNDKTNFSDIFSWLCIEKLKHCCPENHFGADCKPCDGFPESVCSKNGKCKGSGTRKGNGECLCNEGYQGSKCDECASLYYKSYKDEEKLLCSKCHHACKRSCTFSGPKGCVDCNPGWLNDPEHGCLDINECATLNPCKRSEFCVNTEGSFACLKCDGSCDGCHGDGPDMCSKCAEGFHLKDGICEQRDRNENMDYARYLTYLGLCVATCIIFQKNTLVASIIGLLVAIYVSVSEYMLHNI